jgi:hypothetical protein
MWNFPISRLEGTLPEYMVIVYDVQLNEIMVGYEYLSELDRDHYYHDMITDNVVKKQISAGNIRIYRAAIYDKQMHIEMGNATQYERKRIRSANLTKFRY